MREEVRILLLSGPVAVGKTSFAAALVEHFGFAKLRSGGYLALQAREQGLATDRTSLQQLGDSFDALTDYRWVVDQVASPTIGERPEQRLWLFDAVRKHRQVMHFRDRFPDSLLHIHLIAPEAVLRARYDARLAAGGEYLGGTPYDDAVKHPNEVESRSLQLVADLVLDTKARSPQELAADAFGALEGKGR